MYCYLDNSFFPYIFFPPVVEKIYEFLLVASMYIWDFAKVILFCKASKHSEYHYAKMSNDNEIYQVSDKNLIDLKQDFALKNMKEASRLINTLSDYGINSVEELNEKISELEMHMRQLKIIETQSGYEELLEDYYQINSTLMTFYDIRKRLYENEFFNI